MIADEAQAVAKIRAFFEAGWAEETPLVFDDETYTPQATVEFCRLNIRHNTGDQTTMGDPGNNRHMLEGGITLQIFTPRGNHSVRARELMARATAIFRGKDTENIHFYQTTPREIGDDGHGFYQINVNVRFRYDLFA